MSSAESWPSTLLQLTYSVKVTPFNENLRLETGKLALNDKVER